ncbi:single-stranded-DNA-specific exonuclease RecJ [Salinibacter ruber]|uniref:Single-stranded-DNA-specific exonuclease RecJ n=1 Tax=Salinibacter ruber TaxID=146919 RepID=A0A9X2UC07_9BACT|nr:single-stranded-DNA-specific exonuclease RecJ [Salinibacter ruber]MCS3953367.1 single-stranded-DNA-specific exonuclease [Salinibacter ruber]MCS4054088.1 single-stranded-DNA-specific exonuclease [Salinibacter ruber]MCS4184664.1 single-stranded-DNA-specific exonuclease [Salinibacter ruber]
MAEWTTPSSPVPGGLEDLAGGNALVAKLLAQRGIQSVEDARPFLDPAAYDPAPPEDLPDLEKGVRRIRSAIERGERVLVWGDFDVDGQTSTALLVEALRKLGAEVDYHVPHRERESHGVNWEHLEGYLDDGVGVVLTCDTGVSSNRPIRKARNRGVDVVVTDHHDLPSRLPPAEALINPKRLPERHPLGTLPGVGVAYKFVQKLAEGQNLTEGTGLRPTGYLDLVALGIVADIAVLRGDTRYLLQLGLEKLRETGRPGLQAVMDSANVTREEADEEDIGFRIGPRLNAVGRLGDANVSVPLLTTSDPGEARAIAGDLEELNDRRKLLTAQVFEAARKKLRWEPELLQTAVLVLYGEQWPAGVIGIVAHRLTEKYHKPTILLTSASEEYSRKEGDSEDQEALTRGSARSVEDLNITAAIADHADMLQSFGGHPMAAGVTLPEAKIGRFRRLVSRSIVGQKGGEEIVETLQIDSYLSLEELTLQLAEDLRQAAPFGPGNREPVFACRNLRVSGYEEIGSDGGHLKVTVTGPKSASREVLWWNAQEEDLPDGIFDLAVTVSTNVFRGERSLQLTWEDSRVRRKETGEETGEARSTEVIGHRGEGGLEDTLRALADRGDAQVWMEARQVDGVGAKSRLGLAPCKELVLGTLPPSRPVLEEALAACEPERIHVVGLPPTTETKEGFTRRLLGLCKHAIRSGKAAPLPKLSAAMGHEERTVRLGLQWLEERGQIQAAETGQKLSIKPGSGSGEADSSLEQALEEALQEARAFRKYALRGEAPLAKRSAAK